MGVTYFVIGEHRYPAAHWSEIRRFVVGDETDPRGLFRLADDTWEAWPYGEGGRPSAAIKHRYRFARLRSFLKPYVKWYCHQRLIGRGEQIRQGPAAFPYGLSLADDYIIKMGIRCLDDLATPEAFAALWEAQLPPLEEGGGPRPHTATLRQEKTHKFWECMRAHFGAPQVVPPIAPHVRQRPTTYALDETKLIPLPVINQFVNKLGLHRDGVQQLNRYHHLRLCVLVLNLCLGRRIGEILGAPRGSGRDGPLHRYPYRDGLPEGALWFRFSPSKDGPSQHVYVSPEWEDLFLYCVRVLIGYGDEVRDLAPPAERGLLILVSRWNWTKGVGIAGLRVAACEQDFSRAGTRRRLKYMRRVAGGLGYAAFYRWLVGSRGWDSPKRDPSPGVLRLWNITADGSADGAVYRLRSHQGRHNRQDALAGDPRVSVLARQHDLNHRDRDMQSAYQHRFARQNRELLEKLGAGRLIGNGVEWLSAVTGVKIEPPAASPQPRTEPAEPDGRWCELVKSNPQFLQSNRVPCGLCVLPQGPAACEEYLNCTDARDGGCPWFVTDTGDEGMLRELDGKAREQRRRQRESTRAGRHVQAGKRESLARRTEALRDEALRLAPAEMVERLRRKSRQIEEGGA